MTFGKMMAAGFLAASLAAIGSASPLLPGQTTSLFAGTLPGTDTLLTTVSGTFSNSLENGSYSTKVYKNSATGFLDFVYSFAINSSSIDSMKKITLSSYAGFTTDVYYINNADVAPTSADRSNAGTTAVTFYFGQNGVAPGKTADTAVISTNATNYTAGLMGFQDGYSFTVDSLAPCPTPEPMTYSLLGVGLAAMGLLKRKLV